jgi:hypothetical protein
VKNSMDVPGRTEREKAEKNSGRRKARYQGDGHWNPFNDSDEASSVRGVAKV